MMSMPVAGRGGRLRVAICARTDTEREKPIELRCDLDGRRSVAGVAVRYAFVAALVQSAGGIAAVWVCVIDVSHSVRFFCHDRSVVGRDSGGPTRVGGELSVQRSRATVDWWARRGRS
jgi:hypothetical protein